jgi:putative nucleotidyltransferase with HDIG domain
MLSGRLPLDNEDLLQLLFAHLNQVPPDLRALVPEVSIKTEAAVMRALRKSPSERFPNMRGFRAALLDPIADTPRVLPVEALAPTDNPPPMPKPLEVVPLPARVPEPAPPKLAELVPLAQREREPPPEKPADPAKANTDAKQPKRVANRLARIVLERLHGGRLQLPTLSTSAMRCLEQLRVTNVSASQLADTLARDPLLASQVIRRANSVLVGGGARVRTLEFAIGRLGALQLRALLMELSTRRLFESRNPAIRRAFQELWDHALAVAQVAQQLAQRCPGADSEMAYLAGLLHDIGKPVTAAVLLEAERQAVRTAEEWLNANNWLEIVADCHREVGVATARTWLLPEDIIHAIARSNRYTPEGRTATANLVCFANALAKDQGVYAGEVDKEEVQMLIRQGQDLYGVSDEQLLQIRATIRRKKAGAGNS